MPSWLDPADLHELEERERKRDMSDTTVPQRPLTFGEKAVGLTFNPSGDPLVAELKKLYAEIIDLCEKERARIMERRIKGEPNEQARLWALAITEAQTAQMWSVKAATWRD